MLIRDVMTGSVVTAGAAASVREVAELMRERNVGSVVLVAADGVATGIVTDRDIVVGAVADGRDASDPIEGLASAPLVTGGADLTIEDAAQLMITHAIRRLPVVDAGRLTGIVTLDDLAVRSGDPAIIQSVTTQITRAAMPGFYFDDRGA